jgi:hypothetical protein
MVSYGGSSSDWLTVLLWLLISLAVSWLIIYTAVRAATGHALDRSKPRLVAETHTTPEGVHFVISNIGSAPAVNVAVRWSDRPAGAVLAQTQLLGPSGKLEWAIAAGPIPGETESLHTLKVDWSSTPDPSFGRSSTSLVVLVPSRLDTLR